MIKQSESPKNESSAIPSNSTTAGPGPAKRKVSSDEEEEEHRTRTQKKDRSSNENVEMSTEDAHHDEAEDSAVTNARPPDIQHEGFRMEVEVSCQSKHDEESDLFVQGENLMEMQYKEQIPATEPLDDNKHTD